MNLILAKSLNIKKILKDDAVVQLMWQETYHRKSNKSKEGNVLIYSVVFYTYI